MFAILSTTISKSTGPHHQRRGQAFFPPPISLDDCRCECWNRGTSGKIFRIERNYTGSRVDNVDSELPIPLYRRPAKMSRSVERSPWELNFHQIPDQITDLHLSLRASQLRRSLQLFLRVHPTLDTPSVDIRIAARAS